MSVQQEMQELTKIRTKAGEPRQEFLTRIIIAMSDEKLVSDDDLKTMSPEADEWYKAAGQAYDKQEPLPDFPEDEEPETVDEQEDEPELEAPDFPEDEPEPEEDSTMATTQTETKTRGRKAAAPAPAAKKSAARKRASVQAANNSKRAVTAASSGRPMGDGARGQITAWLIKNPKLTNEQIHEKLKKQGNKTSFVTVKSTRSALKSFIAELNKAGHKIKLQV